MATTRLPRSAYAAAISAEIVVLPTPPLPTIPIFITCLLGGPVSQRLPALVCPAHEFCQDLFLAGKTATVAEVVHDVDGNVHIAVTGDDDPAASCGTGTAAGGGGGWKHLQVRRRVRVGRGQPTARRAFADDAWIVDDGIGGVHLAFDLADRVETPILVDTVPDAGGPGSVAVIEVEPGSFGATALDAHDLDPGAMFRCLGSITDHLPRTLVVGCQPATLEDGIGLSDEVTAAVPLSADKVLQLLRVQLGGPG